MKVIKRYGRIGEFDIEEVIRDGIKAYIGIYDCLKELGASRDIMPVDEAQDSLVVYLRHNDFKKEAGLIKERRRLSREKNSEHVQVSLKI